MQSQQQLIRHTKYINSALNRQTTRDSFVWLLYLSVSIAIYWITSEKKILKLPLTLSISYWMLLLVNVHVRACALSVMVVRWRRISGVCRIYYTHAHSAHNHRNKVSTENYRILMKGEQYTKLSSLWAIISLLELAATWCCCQSLSLC